MKGTIIRCLEQLVSTQFGQAQWERALEAAGFKKNKMFLPFEDVDDALTMKLVQSVCATLHLSPTQAADAFGEYWVTTYSQELYHQYYAQSATAKDFLLALDKLHVIMTRAMPNAHPPRFEYEWKDAKTLLMHYKSQRGMIDFAVGLVKGVGKFYHETLNVTKLNETTLQILF
jgi:hypothetical protein